MISVKYVDYLFKMFYWLCEYFSFFNNLIIIHLLLHDRLNTAQERFQSFVASTLALDSCLWPPNPIPNYPLSLQTNNLHNFSCKHQKALILPWLLSLTLSWLECFKASISGLSASLRCKNCSYEILPCASAPNCSINSSRESSRLNSRQILRKSWL